MEKNFWRQESYLWVSKRVDEKREWGNKNDNDWKIINHSLRSTLHKLPFSYRMSENDLVMLFPKENISVPPQNDASHLPKEFVHLQISFILKTPTKSHSGFIFSPPKRISRIREQRPALL